MRLFGSISYVWDGNLKAADASPPGEPMPVVIHLLDEWVTVSRPIGGTELVAWESVSVLRGWAPVPEEDR